MPNWVMNSVTITGSKERITSLADAVNQVFEQDEAEQGICSLFVPEPTEADMPAGNGPFPDWYAWRLNNWGTKWDFATLDRAVVEENDNGDSYIVLDFDTAWSPPLPLYKQIELMGFEVSADFCEPGMQFVGFYEDGESFTTDYSDCTASDIRDSVPSNLVDKYGLVEMLEEMEEENE